MHGVRKNVPIDAMPQLCDLDAVGRGSGSGRHQIDRDVVLTHLVGAP
jgi:hypothetical protein